MATSIHHGPPGSFKSFTLVQRSAIDALKEGRVVVTNIRGLTSIDRIQDQFPDAKFPDSADLWYIDTEVAEQRDWMARWFQWVPMRALIIIDECQRIYPNRRDFKAENLDAKIIPPHHKPDEISIEINDEYTGRTSVVHRPEDVLTAFDMQRHFQWDIYLSTPNIDKVKDFIRQTAETAYRHKSLSGKLPPTLAKLFGLHNSWYEFQHDPENSGKFASNIIGKPRKYRADQRVFRCYQSTATGEHTASKADQSILGDPKLKMLLGVLVLAIASLFYTLLTYSRDHRTVSSAVVPADPAHVPDSKKADTPRPAVAGPVSVAVRDLHPVDVSQRKTADFFADLGYKLLFVSFRSQADESNTRLEFLAKSDDGSFVPVLYSFLNALGVVAAIHSPCRITLMHATGATLSLTCYPPPDILCTSIIDAPGLVSRRGCRRRSDPVESTPSLPVPQPALLTAANNLVH